MSVKYFPLDLQNKIENGTCCIKFGVRDINDADIEEDIYLYMPPGINIPDGATYNNVNLGLIGAATRDVVDSNADTLSDQDFNSTDFITAVTKRIQGDGMGGLGVQNALAGVELGRGEVTNPYTAVQFDGVTVRNFTFNFRLISESAEEAIAIKNIEDCFRAYMYAEEAGKIRMKYPKLFTIEFLAGSKKIKSEDEEDETIVLMQNKFMPRIIPSFLTNLNVTYNESTNLFHTDGSPVETAIAVTFTEEKALTRNDLYDSKTTIQYPTGN